MIKQDRANGYNPPNPPFRPSEEYQKLIREHIADFTKFRFKQPREHLPKDKVLDVDTLNDKDTPRANILGKEIKNT